jgi:hypothetical protein
MNQAISEATIEAALSGALPIIYENLTLPFGASVNDYPNLDDLRAADAAAEEANLAVLRTIMRAALEASAPLLLAQGWDAGRDAMLRAVMQGDDYPANPHEATK